MCSTLQYSGWCWWRALYGSGLAGGVGASGADVDVDVACCTLACGSAERLKLGQDLLRSNVSAAAEEIVSSFPFLFREHAGNAVRTAGAETRPCLSLSVVVSVSKSCLT